MLKMTIAGTAALLLGATVGLAQTYELFDQNGAWNVFHNTETKGCFMERLTNEGIVIQIGSLQSMLDGEGTTVGAFMGIYVPGEAPAGSGGNPNLVLKLGPNTYDAKAFTVSRDDYWGGYFVSEGDQDLAWDVQNRNTMEIHTSNGALVKIKLNRTGFAMNEAIKATQACQAKYN